MIDYDLIEQQQAMSKGQMVFRLCKKRPEVGFDFYFPWGTYEDIKRTLMHQQKTDKLDYSQWYIQTHLNGFGINQRDATYEIPNDWRV